MDEARFRELVTAYLGLRGSTEALSEEDRFSLLNGAAMALLGDEYRPPSPTSEFSAPVDLNAERASRRTSAAVSAPGASTH